MLYGIICRWDLKFDTNELTCETEATDTESRFVVATGKGEREGMDWEFGISRCKLLHIKWVGNRVLLYNTGTYVQNSVISHSGKEYEKGYLYTGIMESLCYSAKINTAV